jgi:hypothetical protein
MAYTDLNLGLKASANVEAGVLVEVSGVGTCAPASADSTKVIGVTFTDASTNDVVAVCTEGALKVEASGSITAGDLVKAGSLGTAVTGGSGDNVVGLAINSAADGEEVVVLLK